MKKSCFFSGNQYTTDEGSEKLAAATVLAAFEATNTESDPSRLPQQPLQAWIPVSTTFELKPDHESS